MTGIRYQSKIDLMTQRCQVIKCRDLLRGHRLIRPYGRGVLSGTHGADVDFAVEIIKGDPGGAEALQGDWRLANHEVALVTGNHLGQLGNGGCHIKQPHLGIRYCPRHHLREQRIGRHLIIDRDDAVTRKLSGPAGNQLTVDHPVVNPYK
ncbi:hypothetical protein D3C72_1563350 [compost metagenome]